MVDRLKRLRTAARGGSDERFRRELKAAIRDLVRNRTLRIDVRRVGTVYHRTVITDDQVAQLRRALAAVDALPAASERRIAAGRVLEAIPTHSILDRIESGMADWIPSVERIDVEVPFDGDGSRPGPARATIRIGGELHEVEVRFAPASASRLPAAIARAWADAL